MFTNLKIEPSLWPWAYLQSIEGQDTTQWIENRDQVPTIYLQNGIGSEHDVRFNFKDMYIDLAKEVEHDSELSIQSEQNYLS